MSIESLGVVYSAGGRRFQVLSPLADEVSLRHGRALCRQTQVEGGIRIDIDLELNGALVFEEVWLEWRFEPGAFERFFVNGYQSWTTSREHRFDERIRPLHWMFRPFARHSGDHDIFPGRDRRGSLHSFSYTYLRASGRWVKLLGSLDEASGFTIFELNRGAHRVRIHKDLKGLRPSTSLKAMSVFISDPMPQDAAFESWFRHMEIEPPAAPAAAGWTSWYNYFNDISEELILDHVKGFKELGAPLTWMQIDDGYQAAVGDWLTTNRQFPRGMAPLAEAIREAGFRPGLWLAPLAVEGRSRLYAEHPDWLISDRRGRPVKAGYNPLWSGPFYALDLSKEVVREHLTEVFKTVTEDWGFELLKLDFLFVAAFGGGAQRTRGQAVSDALRFFREVAAPGTRLLGCGVPLGPGFGVFDYCRVSADVDLQWEQRWLKAMRLRERLSTVNAITSTIGRCHLNRRVFLNDPDVFILRAENHELTAAQCATLLFVNALFGELLFNSDDPWRYGDQQRFQLRSLFPIRPRQLHHVENKRGLYRVRFDIDDGRYFALINLRDDTETLVLPEGLYFHPAKGFVEGPQGLDVEAHGHLCVRLVDGRPGELLGGSRHLFPGAEVLAVEPDGRGYALRLDEQNHNAGEVSIGVPRGRGAVRVGGREYPVKHTDYGSYITVEVAGRA